MTKFYSITGTVAFVTLMGSTSAFADISATEAWADYKANLTSAGFEITGDETISGDTLTISNLTMELAGNAKAPSVSIDFKTLGFQDLGDGTVSVLIAENPTIKFSKVDELKVVLEYALGQSNIIASGDVNNITYTYTSESMALSLMELMLDGKPIPDAVARITIKDISGNTKNTIGDMRETISSLTTGRVDYQVSLPDPAAEGDVFTVIGGMDTFAFSSDGVLPLMPDYNDVAKLFSAGLKFNFDGSWSNGNLKANITERGASTEISSKSSGGNAKMRFDENGIGYGAGAMGVKAVIQTPDLPFPVEYEFANADAYFAMPLNKYDTPSDASLLLKLIDFNTSEMIWGLADPTGALPHGPATIIVDVSSKIKWLLDPFNPGATPIEFAKEDPLELHALTLKALQLKIAGADLTGNGAFTFDNNDMETFPDFPLPEGALDLKLVGGNGLLDKLIQMGLVQEDQAMGARMMMGLFAQPGEGEDTLTSKIEVKDGGHVYANGQRLK